MKIYEDRKNLFRPFLFGVTLTYVAIDNILNGPLRGYMSKYFDLKEFGTNTREEYLYYLIHFSLIRLNILVFYRFYANLYKKPRPRGRWKKIGPRIKFVPRPLAKFLSGGQSFFPGAPGFFPKQLV